jgi:hypothetical protein
MRFSHHRRGEELRLTSDRKLCRFLYLAVPQLALI